MRFNQYTKISAVRDVRLPSVSVSKMERATVEATAKKNRITMSQMQRCGLVLLGVLDTESLNDVPEDLAERISAGKGLSPVRVKVRP